MFYSYEIEAPASAGVGAKKEIEMSMSAGIIHQVDVLFPDTADHDIAVQIFDSSLQLWPSNRGAKIRGDATVVSFRDFYEMKIDNNILTAKAWRLSTGDAVTVFIHIGVLPRSVLQPFSLAELLRAVQRR
jgi:hypothetical protein